MEVDKLKKWLDVAQQFQSEQFWHKIFDDKDKNTTGNSHSLNPLSAVKEFFPRCDLYESDGVLVVEAEVPGLTSEDLHISIHQQLLTITGEFKAFQQNRKYYLKERANRQFKKELTLPFPIFVNQIRSEIQNGMLVIVMPVNHEEIETIPITFEHSNPE